jgi:hypothetical protein
MTTIDAALPARPGRPAPGAHRPTDYRHAHWYFLAALAAIVAGFWPSFFRPLGASDAGHTIHGVTATLWVVALAVQSALISRGNVRWHRRVARGAFVLLPVLAVSALHMIRVMLLGPMPADMSNLLAFLDFLSTGFMVLLVALGLNHWRTPQAHKRYMAATVLLAFPPSLTRLYAFGLPLGLDFHTALHGSLVTVHVILLALIATDLRNGVRRAAYPLTLAFFLAMHALMLPVSAAGWWRGFTAWFAAGGAG